MPGDDLVDDFVPDEIVALSEAEDDSPVEGSESEGSPSTILTSVASQSDLVAATAKRKRRQKEKERKAKKRRLAEPIQDAGDPQTWLSNTPPDKLCEFLSQKQTKALKELSTIELEDWRIPESCIADTTHWHGPRSLDILPEFIAKTLPTLKVRLGQRPKSMGAPTLIFIAAAALRVADVTRILKRMKEESNSTKAGDIAKLFGKHFKLEEHGYYLQKTRVGAAVGTPGRIGKLLCETEALSVAALSHIIIDTTFQDAKKRTIFDIPETREEVFRIVLGSEGVRKGLQSGSVTLVLF